MYIKRALEPLVEKYSQHFKVVVVTGPRQVGKTTMLKHLIAQDVERGSRRAYVSLDTGAMRALAKEDPALFLQRFQPPVLIDEIQKAPELLPYIKEIVDNSDETGLFWLTGSQPLHLMKEVSESLAGRAGIIEMLGLSNAEIAEIPSEVFNPGAEYFARRVADMPALAVTEAFERIHKGSLPGIRNSEDADLLVASYDSYIDTYIMRDIRDLAQVSDELKFRRFLSACAALTSKPVVYAELARIADIDEKTAKAWLSLLVSTYLVKIVPAYSNNLLKRLSKQPIMHFTDTGLAAHLAGWHNAEALEMGAMSGQIFETYAFGEIYKSYINAGKKPSLFFFRTQDQREIDLLIDQNGTLFPIEIKKKAEPVKGDVRSFAAINVVANDVVDEGLRSFKREIGMGTVVCMAKDTCPLKDGVWTFPVWAI